MTKEKLNHLIEQHKKLELIDEVLENITDKNGNPTAHFMLVSNNSCIWKQGYLTTVFGDIIQGHLVSLVKSMLAKKLETEAELERL